MRNAILFVSVNLTLFLLVGCRTPTPSPTPGGLAGSTVTVSAPPIFGSGQRGGTCPGSYTAHAGFRNLSGSLAWTAPEWARTCRVADVTVGTPTSYLSRVEVGQGIRQVACGDRAVTFPATPNGRYMFTIYVISGSLATNQSLSLSVEWKP